MFRFLHAADLHIDSPLTGLSAYESAPVEQVRGATRRALENLVALAIEQQVAFVLLSGDIYDGDWKDYRTGLFFRGQLARLEQAGVRVALIAGNHDAASQISRDLSLPGNVMRFGSTTPTTKILEDYAVALHGQGFATRAVTEDLAASYPEPLPGMLNIGLLHTALDGRAGHGTYAPTSITVLAGKMYDYWALGHVHNREVVSTAPWIVWPGNTQGRNARETGPKGCSLVCVEDAKITSVAHHDLDVVRWAALQVDLDGAVSAHDMLDRVDSALRKASDEADGRVVCARIQVQGAAACHDAIAGKPEHWKQEIRALCQSINGGDVWVEKVRFDTNSLRSAGEIAARSESIAAFLGEGSDPMASEDIPAVKEVLEAFRHALTGEVTEGPDGFDPNDETTLTRLMAEARALLASRFGGAGTAP